MNGAKAHFFIGELLQKESQGGEYALHLCGTEYAPAA